MTLKFWIVLTVTYLKFSSSKENYSEITNLIVDFVKEQHGPTEVIAFVCWPKEVQMELFKKLSENFIYTQIWSVGRPMYYPSEGHRQLFLIDARCVGGENILERANNLNLLNRPFRWLILSYDDGEIFNGVYFGMDSKAYVIEKGSLGYRVKFIYKHAEKSTRFVENSVGFWDSSQGFLNYSEATELKKRTDLEGHDLNVSLVITKEDTLNHLWDYRNTEVDAITKVNFMLAHHLAEFLNATLIILFRDSWGYRNVTTSLFSGMIGELQSGNAEIAGTPAYFTPDRMEVVEFVACTTPSLVRFIFRAPPLTYVTNIFTLPFDTYVWYSSFVLIAAILAVVYVIVVWEWKSGLFKERHTNTKLLKPDVADVILFELGAITQQGAEEVPRSYSGRIASILTFIALMFLYTSYSANIVALLQSTSENIRTLEDLLNSRISLGVEDIIYNRYFFETADEPITKAIYEQKVAPKGQAPNFMTALEGVQRMQQEFFAFHIELTTGYKLVNELFQESQKCSLKEINFINFVQPWLSVRKNSSYKEIFKIGYKRMYEAGIQSREVSRIYTKKPKCDGSGTSFGSAGLVDCYAAFLIFGIGVGCSLMVIIMEKLVKIYQDNKLIAVDQDIDESGTKDEPI